MVLYQFAEIHRSSRDCVIRAAWYVSDQYEVTQSSCVDCDSDDSRSVAMFHSYVAMACDAIVLEFLCKSVS